jgi:hypothetical protein
VDGWMSAGYLAITVHARSYIIEFIYLFRSIGLIKHLWVSSASFVR